MTSPTYHETTESASNTPSTSHSVTLTAPTDGDLLLAFLEFNSSVTVTEAGGEWTALSQNAGSPGQFDLWGRIADGAEGGSVTFTTSSTQAGAFHVVRLSATNGGLVEGTDWDITVGSITESATQDPPSVTASWGSDDNLFIAAVGYRGDNETVSAYPTGYSNTENQVTTNGGGGGAGIATATKTAAAAADNPSAFTLTGSERGFAATLVVAPTPGVNAETATGTGTGHDITTTTNAVTATGTGTAHDAIGSSNTPEPEAATATGTGHDAAVDTGQSVDSGLTLEWDFDGDGNYDQSVEDITSFVLSGRCRVGRDYPSQLTGRATAGELRLTLNNDDDRFVIYNTASPVNSGAFSLKTGRRIRLRTTESTPTDINTLARDQFSSTGALGTTDDGLTWTTQAGGYTRGSGVATATTVGVNIATVDVGATDYYLQGRYDFRDTTNKVGVVLRFTDPNNFSMARITSSRIKFTDVVAGVETETTEVLIERRPHVTFGVLVSGATVTTYLDGVPIETASTVSGSSTSTLVGLYADWVTQRAPAFEEFNVWSGVRVAEPGVLFTGTVREVTPTVTNKGVKQAKVVAVGDLAAMDSDVSAPSSIGVSVTNPAGVQTGVMIGSICGELGLIHPPAPIAQGDITLGAVGVEQKRAITLARRMEENEIGFLHEAPQGGISFAARSGRVAAVGQATFSDAPGPTDLAIESVRLRNRHRDLINRVSARVSPTPVEVVKRFGVQADNAAGTETDVSITVPNEAPHADDGTVGDLLLVFIVSSVHADTNFWLTPIGWTNLNEVGDQIGRHHLYAKRLESGDFGTSVKFYDDVTTFSGGAWHASLIMIRDWFGTVDSGVAVAGPTGFGLPGTQTEANTGTNDPPVMFTPWPVTPTLFIAARSGSISGSGGSVSAAGDANAPNNFGDMLSSFVDATAGAAFDVAHQHALLWASESVANPSPFGGTFSGFDYVDAATIAVRGFEGDPPDTAGGKIVTANNIVSQQEHGVVAHKSPARLLPDTATADTYNDVLLGRHDQDRPILTVGYTANKSLRHRNEAVERLLSDRVTVTADGPVGFGITATDFFVETIRYSFSDGIKRLTVEYDLSPAVDPGGGADTV